MWQLTYDAAVIDCRRSASHGARDVIVWPYQ
jgi:hypothetical protein